MVPTWYPIGTKLVPTWYQVGALVLITNYAYWCLLGSYFRSTLPKITPHGWLCKVRQDVLRFTDRAIYCVGNHDTEIEALGKVVVSSCAAMVFLSSGTLESTVQLKVILEAMSMAQYVTQADSASALGEQRPISLAKSAPQSASALGLARSATQSASALGLARSATQPSVLAVIPIVIPGFTFPGTEFYDKRLPRLWTENVVTAEALIRSFFKRIAVTFATWASDKVLDAQAQEILSRIPRQFTRSDRTLAFFSGGPDTDKPSVISSVGSMPSEVGDSRTGAKVEELPTDAEEVAQPHPGTRPGLSQPGLWSKRHLMASDFSPSANFRGLI